MIHGSYKGEYYKLGEVGLQGGTILGCFVAVTKKEATRSIPTANDEFSLPEDFPTASEERFLLLSQKDATAEEVCTADKVMKKTEKKITIQGTNVAGFDKSNVECFNCHKRGHFARECRAPKSQDRGRRENFKQGSKVEESAPKALLAIDKVEARLVEFKNQEIKFCEKIRGLKFKVKSKDNRIKRLTKELEELKKENEGLDSKLIVYSPSKKDMSWTGLPEFADDTITDYSRPSPSIESNSSDLQNSGSSIFEKGDSSESIMLNP
nr:hypothetical protein [Tanacetum cinerariifolium]